MARRERRRCAQAQETLYGEERTPTEEEEELVREHEALFEKMNALFDGKSNELVMEVCLHAICMIAADQKSPPEEFSDYVKIRYEQMLALTKTFVTDAAQA
jgi:hypothetical protein